MSGPGGYRGGFRGGLRGLRGGLRGSPHGGRGGGYGRGGYPAGGRIFSDEELYQPYGGPDQQAGIHSGTYDPGYPGYGYSAGGYEAEPNQQIMVRNVSQLRIVLDLLARWLI